MNVSQLDIQGACVSNVELNVSTCIRQSEQGLALKVKRTGEADVSSQLIRCWQPSPKVLRPLSVRSNRLSRVVGYLEGRIVGRKETVIMFQQLSQQHTSNPGRLQSHSTALIPGTCPHDQTEDGEDEDRDGNGIECSSHCREPHGRSG